MSPTVRIDDEVYERLKSQAEPFVDTPNSVLRRLLGLGTLTEERECTSEEELVDSQPAASEPHVLRSPSPTRRAKKKVPQRKRRIPAGSVLPESEYDLPLLGALIELGGSAPSREVTERVGVSLKGKLTEADYERLASGGIRWENRLQFVRLRLIQQGLMIKESGRGVWAISDEGRSYFDRHRTEGAD